MTTPGDVVSEAREWGERWYKYAHSASNEKGEPLFTPLHAALELLLLADIAESLAVLKKLQARQVIS